MILAHTRLYRRQDVLRVVVETHYAAAAADLGGGAGAGHVAGVVGGAGGGCGEDAGGNEEIAAVASNEQDVSVDRGGSSLEEFCVVYTYWLAYSVA